MDNNCVDCQAHTTAGMYSRCKVCYLLKKMCGLEKQLSRTKSLYWRALVDSILPPTISPSDLKNSPKKVDSCRDIQTAYLTLAERIKSGKIDSFQEVSTVVYPDVITCKYSATRGSYTMYRKVSSPTVATVGEAMGIVLRKLISYIDSYDYNYKPDLDYDYDHEDELGRPLYPPKRTEKETEILQKELDRELNEYMGRNLGVSSTSLNKVSPKSKSIGLGGIILERRDNPEWYLSIYRSILNSVLKKEIPQKYFKVLTAILDEAKTELKVKERRERFGLSPELNENKEYIALKKALSSDSGIDLGNSSSLVGLEWD